MKVVESKYPESNFEVIDKVSIVESLNRPEVYWTKIDGGYRNYISENVHRIFEAVDSWTMFENENETIEEEINYLINEKNYADLRSSVTDFLKVRAKSKETPGSTFVGYEDGIMHFKTKSHRLPGVVYDQYVKLLDLDDIVKNNLNKKWIDIARLALKGNIEVHCTDPSWLYFGFQYIGTKKEYSMEPENRPPVIRNPTQSGSVCKHLDNVLYTLPFQASKLANYLKNNYKAK